MFDRALLTIAATDVTAVFSSTPVFVFLFSIFILKEPPLILRVRLCRCESEDVRCEDVKVRE